MITNFRETTTKHAYFSPTIFFISMIMGFFLCVYFGFVASKVAYFKNFLRFHGPISPEMQYYPTINEMIQTVKRTTSPDKILVLISGNSTLRGEGQNYDNLWSSYLQQYLGNDYKVINFANNGAETPSFGTVAFRALTNYYPKIVLVTSSRFGYLAVYDGWKPYNYLFWDAYYRGLLNLEKNEEELVKNIRKEQLTSYDGVEKHLLAWLDSKLYFRNLWNWVAYNMVSTVWTRVYFLPRKFCIDKRFNLERIQKNNLKVKLVAKEVAIIKDFIDKSLDIHDKNLIIFPRVEKTLTESFNEIFPKNIRSKVFFILIPENPFHLKQLEPEYTNANRKIWTTKEAKIAELGYNVLNFNERLNIEDYIDGMHPNIQGGKKIAKATAAKIKMAVKRQHIFEKVEKT